MYAHYLLGRPPSSTWMSHITSRRSVSQITLRAGRFARPDVSMRRPREPCPAKGCNQDFETRRRAVLTFEHFEHSERRCSPLLFSTHRYDIRAAATQSVGFPRNAVLVNPRNPVVAETTLQDAQEAARLIELPEIEDAFRCRPAAMTLYGCLRSSSGPRRRRNSGPDKSTESCNVPRERPFDRAKWRTAHRHRRSAQRDPLRQRQRKPRRSRSPCWR
jgi:hypothetical protein